MALGRMQHVPGDESRQVAAKTAVRVNLEPQF
jgi:hypothetical protein